MDITCGFRAMVATGLLLAIVSTATAEDGGVGQPTAPVETGTYVFLPDQSTLIRTGGRPQRSLPYPLIYSVQGQFQLLIDRDAKTASFAHVDANATYGDPPQWVGLNHVFDLTLLVGAIIDDQTISFTGRASDHSEMRVTATLQEALVHLVGETTPPPGSMDFHNYSLDAVAERKYGGGTGDPNDPYQIATAADLIALGDNNTEDHNKHFILTADIDLDPELPGRKIFDKAVVRGFTGLLDGNRHTISHMEIKGKECVGLFAYLGPGAQVMDLGLVDANVTNAADYSGTLAGQNLGGDVTHCYASGTIDGHWAVGGLIGWNDWGGDLTGCYSAGTVTGKGISTGGLVGMCKGGNIRDCYSTATVTGQDGVGGLIGTYDYEVVGEFVREYRGSVIRCHSTGAVTGAGGRVGGLIGVAWGDVSQCYSTGPVTGRANCVGGLVGENRATMGKVNQCYSTGVVHGDEGYVGGLIGWNNGGYVAECSSLGAVSGKYNVGGLMGSGGWDSGRVIHCYSTGSVSAATTYAGGLIGNAGAGMALACFWDIQSSGQATSAGGTGKTTTEMQDARTYLEGGWDFVGEKANGTEDIWWIDEGRDYPRLWWELPEPGGEQPAGADL